MTRHATRMLFPALVLLGFCASCGGDAPESSGTCEDGSGVWTLGGTCQFGTDTCTATQDGCSISMDCGVVTVTGGVDGSLVSLSSADGTCDVTINDDSMSGTCRDPVGQTCSLTGTRERQEESASPCQDGSGVWMLGGNCEFSTETCTATQDGCDISIACSLATVTGSVDGSLVSLSSADGTCDVTMTDNSMSGTCRDPVGQTCSLTGIREGGTVSSTPGSAKPGASATEPGGEAPASDDFGAPQELVDVCTCDAEWSCSASGLSVMRCEEASSTECRTSIFECSMAVSGQASSCRDGLDGVGCYWDVNTTDMDPVIFCRRRSECDDGREIRACSTRPRMRRPDTYSWSRDAECWWQIGEDRFDQGLCIEQSELSIQRADEICGEETTDGPGPAPAVDCSDSVEMAYPAFNQLCAGCGDAYVTCVQTNGCEANAACASEATSCVADC